MAPSFSDDFRRRLVLDASVLINLNASLAAGRVIAALPNRVVVPDIVLNELRRQPGGKRDDAVLSRGLLAAGLLEAVELGQVGSRHFEALVSGDTASTLDDGEAATIAWALENDAIAVIDERKATRVVADYAPGLQIASTVDMFFHDDVVRDLGRDGLRQAVFLALREARMRVPEARLHEIVGVLTPEQIEQCRSLPARYRQRR